MGCRESKPCRSDGYNSFEAPRGVVSSSARSGRLAAPTDDIVSFVAPFGGKHFVASGVDGWVYLYNWQHADLAGKFRAHAKPVNRMLALGDGQLLTASADATVRLWAAAPCNEDDADTIPAAAFGGAGPQPAVPSQSFVGHRMSVSALELPGDDCVTTLFTGSRDCTVRLWDIEQAKEMQQVKILRNVVTAVRRVPGSRIVAQASEDLKLRLWDTSAGLRAAHEAHAGPNQLICLDVTDDGLYVVCGSKGFSRENCEVKIFDVRTGLRELASAACADQTIEALRVSGPDQCIIASKDGFVRGVSLPDLSVVFERRAAEAGYTALGICRRPATGPVAMTALGFPDGPQLELLAWPDAALRGSVQVLATSEAQEPQ